MRGCCGSPTRTTGSSSRATRGSGTASTSTGSRATIRAAGAAAERRGGRACILGRHPPGAGVAGAPMLINFFYALRAAKLKVSVKEYLTLLEGLKEGVIDNSVDQFYYFARTALVK